LRGAPNVFLETIKRGELDHFDGGHSSSHPTSIVLRLYEAYGGHARVTLNVADHVALAKASITNLLEDETEELCVVRSDESGSAAHTIQLEFHAFEVKTVKLDIYSVHHHAEKEGCVLTPPVFAK
jgi:alpha-mannosidase